MPHQDFLNLTKKERRQLPDSKYMKISHDGHSELTVSYWQANPLTIAPNVILTILECLAPYTTKLSTIRIVLFARQL